MSTIHADNGSYHFHTDEDGRCTCRFDGNDDIVAVAATEQEALDKARKLHYRAVTEKSLGELAAEKAPDATLDSGDSET